MPDLPVTSTVAERESDYGPPEVQHAATAEMFAAWLGSRYGMEFPFDAIDVCAFNVFQKLARRACGKPKRDTWLDVAGYAANADRCEEYNHE